MWLGPRLKFAQARVKLEDAAALVYTNWGGDRWGHTVYCSEVDYWCGQTRRNCPVTTFALLPPMGDFHEEMKRTSYDPIPFCRFSLQPHDAVPEGEVWLVPARFLRSL